MERALWHYSGSAVLATPCEIPRLVRGLSGQHSRFPRPIPVGCALWLLPVTREQSRGMSTKPWVFLRGPPQGELRIICEESFIRKGGHRFDFHRPPRVDVAGDKLHNHQQNPGAHQIRARLSTPRMLYTPVPHLDLQEGGQHGCWRTP